VSRSINLNVGNAKLESTNSSDDLTFNSTIRGIPVSLRKRFKELKDEGLISGSFNQFMINSAIEKLKNSQ
jgi:hypothetical protein